MKIVIVGGGIGGLAIYLFFQKLLPSSPESSLEIIVYESHEGNSVDGDATAWVPDTVGGALGIAPNGLRVLRDLSQGLFTAIANHGYAVSHFWLQSARGWNLARLPATDHGNPQLPTILISRQALWNLLRDRVPDGAIVRGTVSGVTCAHDQRPRISFADGAAEVEADLVIGADGVRSIVRKAVLGIDGESDRYNAVYEGLAGVGGFIPSSQLLPVKSPGRLTMTFGPQGFFGYGACTNSSTSTVDNETVSESPAISPVDKISPAPGPQAVWWSTYSTAHLPDTKNFDRDDIRAQLQSRHGTWADPIIRSIVSSAAVDSIYPTWTTPELPTWERHGVVLIGDAAHALPSSSGQGVSQALEDAQVLALLLERFLGEKFHSNDVTGKMSRDARSAVESQAIAQAAKAYFKLRNPRVKRIAERAKYAGDTKREKSFVGEWLIYFFIWLVGIWPWDNFTHYVVNGDMPRDVEDFVQTREM